MTDLDRLFSPKRHLAVIPSISDSLTAVVTLYDFQAVVRIAKKAITQRNNVMKFAGIYPCNDDTIGSLGTYCGLSNEELVEAAMIIEENAQS